MTLAVLTSCGEESQGGAAAGEETAPTYTPPEPAGNDDRVPEEGAGRDAPRFRVSRGQAQAGRRIFEEAEGARTSTLERSDVVPPGRRIRATEQSVALDGPHDVRVELEPGASGFVLEESPLGLALLSGSAVAVVPPRGGTTPAPLRVATPAATMVIAGAGEAFISVLGPGSVWVAVVAGRLRWGGPSETDETREIVSGESALITVRGEAEIRTGPASVDEARRRRPQLRAEHGSEDVQASLVDAVRELDAAIAETTEVSAEGAALTKALRDRDQARQTAADLRRQAVAHGQRRLTVRERLLTGWEHALVLASREDAERTLLREQRQRVRSWLEQ